MKILLVRPILLNPLTITKAIDCEPLELEYLYTVCRQLSFSVQIYDAVTEKRRFTAVLREYCPDVVAVTGYITQEETMRKYCRLVKKENPRTLTMIGGVHAQLNFKRLYWDEVDFVCRSESMAAFAELLLAIDRKNSLQNINGLCYRENGVFSENKYVPEPAEDLPIPERPILNQCPEAFRYLDLENTAVIKTAFSCPYSCNFCYGTWLHGGKYQERPIEAVLEELRTIDADSVFIVDSDFMVSEIRLRKFIDGVRANKIHKKFICYARADFVAAHPQLTKELCDIGFTYFLVGLESVNDRALQDYHKQTTHEDNQKCMEIIHQNGAVCVALMIADLSFSARDFQEIYSWVKQSKLKYVTVQIYTPIPPTEIYQKLKGRLITHNPKKWDLIHPVVKPEKMSAFQFLLRYRILVMRLFLLGYRRGAYRLIRIPYLLDILRSLFRRIGTRL